MSVSYVAVVAIVAMVGLGIRAGKAIRQRVREQRQAGRVRGVPRVPIASAGEGTLTCVVGELVGELPLIAPFTGRACAYWRVEVEEYVGDAYQTWARCGDEECERAVFRLRDGSGDALVDTAGAEIVVDRSAGARIGPIGEDTPAARDWLKRRGLAETGLFIKRRYRYLESALTAEDAVAVVGMGVREPDPDPSMVASYRDGAPTVLHLSSSAAHRLFITDDPSLTA
jgi:hypothetical protein